jgi:Peptidase family M28
MQVTAELQKEEGRVTGSSAQKYTTGIASFILIVLCAFFAVHRQNPPAPQPASASLAEFASGRAMNHLKMIASKPHPVGSAEHSEVRDYILKALAGLGLNPEVQRSLVVDPQIGGYYVAGSVQNIIARMAGTDNRQAVLLACHYDSVANGPGASDDGASVAALLEVLRTLKAGSPLKNDVIFLFTDGEERGMLGAKAFMDEHPFARDVAVALNFETRGINGPSIMFETSEGNEWLIKEFAAAVQHPVANSLTYDLYKFLPNATDLTKFKNGGLRGMNFAYISGVSSYHTARDSYENIDERSLQHHGSYALSLVRRFGNVSDWPAPAGDAVYFDLFSNILVVYSNRFVLPLMALSLVLFVGLVVLGLRMKRLTIRGLIFSAFSFLLNVIVIGVVMMLTWQAVESQSVNEMEGYVNSDSYAIGFLLLTIALTAPLFIWFRKKTRIENLIVGALFWWVALTVLFSLFVPGGSYLFTWPLLFALIALGVVFISREEMASSRSVIILTLPALSGAILIVPLGRLVVAGFGMEVAWILMVLVVFLLALLYVHLDLLIAIKRWPLTLISGVLGLCFVCAGMLATDFSAKEPKLDHILYALNADTGKAVWGSSDKELDEWTSQFFPSGAERANVADYFPLGEGTFLKGDAPVLALAPPSVAVLDDKTEGGLRTLRLRVASPRNSPNVSIYWKRELNLKALVVNGKRVVAQATNIPGPSPEYRGLLCFGFPEEGVELSLEIKSSDPVLLKVEDRSYGLPGIPSGTYKDRPDYIVPSDNSDCTVVMKSVAFN